MTPEELEALKKDEGGKEENDAKEKENKAETQGEDENKEGEQGEDEGQDGVKGDSEDTSGGKQEAEDKTEDETKTAVNGEAKGVGDGEDGGTTEEQQDENTKGGETGEDSEAKE